LREYVFFDDDKTSFLTKLSSIKSEALEAIDAFESTCQNKIILKQVPDVRDAILSLSESTADDETLSRYLTLMNITEELLSGGE